MRVKKHSGSSVQVFPPKFASLMLFQLIPLNKAKIIFFCSSSDLPSGASNVNADRSECMTRGFLNIIFTVKYLEGEMQFCSHNNFPLCKQSQCLEYK